MIIRKKDTFFCHISIKSLLQVQQWIRHSCWTPAVSSGHSGRGQLHLHQPDCQVVYTCTQGTFLYLKQWPWPSTPTPARLSGSLNMITVDIRLSQTVAVELHTWDTCLLK
jgi:hypothetical protein